MSKTKNNKMKKVLILILLLLQSSCTLLYDRLYYIPQIPSNKWKYIDNLKKQDYIGNRDFTVICKDTCNKDTISIEISTSDEYYRVLATGFILPFIPLFSLTGKYRKERNAYYFMTIVLQDKYSQIDTNNISFLFNEKFVVKPLGIKITNYRNKNYHNFVFKMEDKELLKKIKTVKITTPQANLQCINNVVFERKRKLTLFHLEGLGH